MADGFTEEQLAKIRAAEKYARDLARQEAQRAEAVRPKRKGQTGTMARTDPLKAFAAFLPPGIKLAPIQVGARIPPRASDELELAEDKLKRLMARDVPHIAREAIWDEDQQETHALRAARWWWDRRSRQVLLLCGTKGTGKTYAAAWLAREYLRANPHSRVCWLKAGQLVGAMMFPGKEPETPALAPLVIVDDVGREMQQPETFGEALGQLVETAGIRVVLTTNMTRDPQPGSPGMSFGERFDRLDNGRLTSRMNERVFTADCVGADLRGTGGGF